MRVLRMTARDRRFHPSTYGFIADDAADRTGHTYTTGDIGKWVKQTDTNVRYLITDVVAGVATMEAVPDIDDLASTADGKGGHLIGIYDSGGKITAENVTDALIENRTALDVDEAALAALIADLADTANGKGGSMVAVEDANGRFTGADVEACLDEGKALIDAAVNLGTRSLRVQHGDLTDADDGDSQTLNIGEALPTGAVVLAVEINIATLFSGGGATAVAVDIGGTDTDALCDGHDVFTGASTGRLSPSTYGVHQMGVFSAEQLSITFTPDGSHDLADLDAGDLTVTIWYTVPTAVQSASKTVAYGDMTDEDGSQTFAFAAALPAGAILLAHELNVTALFDDGSACTSDVDLGINGGDTDCIEDGLNTTLATGATGRQTGTLGVRHKGMLGGSTLAVTVNASVNVDTLTAGSVTATVWYIVP